MVVCRLDDQRVEIHCHGGTAAVEAVVSGDVATLQSLLREHPELIHARSARRHHATLLHYVGANGVEGERQTTPKNALDVAQILLDAGAEVDALADMYDEKCTTMSMLVSSSHPNEAGLQTALAEKLLAQEFNREVNTTCSKSNDLELTNIGLEMKNVVEQFREQVQNLE